MYDASLQSLESGIAHSAPQPAAELMQQADVVENRLGEVYKAAGVISTGLDNAKDMKETNGSDISTLKKLKTQIEPHAQSHTTQSQQTETLADAVDTLIRVSKNVHTDLGIDALHDAYYHGYLTGGGDIKPAVRTALLSIDKALSSSEVAAGDKAALGEMKGRLANIDSVQGVGDNGIGSLSRGLEIKYTKPTLPKGSKPKGNYGKPDIKDPQPIERQNESADLLADQGYDVTMLSETTGGNGYGIEIGSNPDFLINTEPFDCYAPNSPNVRNIWSTIKLKTMRQASRIVLNLDDYSGSIDSLYNQFTEWPIETLFELIVIKSESITRWIP